MPAISGFRGLTYSLDRFGTQSIPARVRLPDEPEAHPGRLADLSDLVCPPYDVVTDADRQTLLARNPHNAIRLEASAEADPYSAAAERLTAWTTSGVLTRSAQASVYYYAHGIRQAPDEPAVRGVLARVLLEPWGSGVRPHERTHAGPKRDRLELLRATGTQLSPILAVYFDRSERYSHVMSRSWADEWRARDLDGLLHQVVAVEPDERLTNYLARQRLVIADGHHRYETALAYRDEVRARPEHRGAPEGSLAVDWVMAVLVNAELEELEILATHRLLRGLHEGELESLRRVVAGGTESLAAHEVAPGDLERRLAETRDAETPVFGVVLDSHGFVLTARPEAVAERMRSERMSTAAQRLDVSVLHAVLLNDVLGWEAGAAAAEGRLLYTKSTEEAIQRVTSADAQVAVLLRPTRIEQLAAVAQAGDVMPQKSTYFYPKLLTGMVFNPLED